MNDHEFDMLRLENQLCFPLYACSKEIIRRYKPYLDPMDLTYTQYITLMVLWDQNNISVKTLGEMLYLDSGTLTPLLKKLESKGYIVRSRCEKDERCVIVRLTQSGLALREQAAKIPPQLGACVKLPPEEARQLHELLYKVLKGLE